MRRGWATFDRGKVDETMFFFLMEFLWDFGGNYPILRKKLISNFFEGEFMLNEILNVFCRCNPDYLILDLSNSIGFGL
jgi:hypothetical protein